jgi:hypothetical protein
MTRLTRRGAFLTDFDAGIYAGRVLMVSRS